MAKWRISLELVLRAYARACRHTLRALECVSVKICMNPRALCISSMFVEFCLNI